MFSWNDTIDKHNNRSSTKLHKLKKKTKLIFN